jgi:hypothetical protein
MNFSEAKWGRNFYISHLSGMAFNRLLATLCPLRAIEHVTSLNCANNVSSALSRVKISAQGLMSTWGSQTNYVKPFSILALERLADCPCWCITKFTKPQPFKSNTLILQGHVNMESPSTFKRLKFYCNLRFLNESRVCPLHVPPIILVSIHNERVRS